MIFTNSDGGSRGNPGPGAIGILVRDEGKILTKFSKFIGDNITNNEAEYTALIEVLKMASEITDGKIICVLDSELVVKQMRGEYKVRHPALLELYFVVKKLEERFQKVSYIHAPREDEFQVIVDELLNEELDRRKVKKKFSR